MLATFVLIFTFTRLCLAQTTLDPYQISAAVASADTLSSLEQLGLSVLSEILASSLAIVIETPSASSTSSESSTFATSTSASQASSAAPSSTISTTGPTASGLLPTASTDHTSNTPSHSDRNLAIVLGTLLGVLLLALIVGALWFCCRRRKRNISEQRAVTPIEDDEVNTWQRPTSERQTVQEANAQPAPPYQPAAERPIAGAYAPIPRPYHQDAGQNPFEDGAYGYNNHTHQPAENVAAYNHSPGSSEELHDRSPTPFFGGSSNAPVDTSYNGGAAAIGKAPHNGAVVTRRPLANDASLHKGDRGSTSAEPGYNDATTYNGGPWIPPAPPRSPRRPRSLPRSPLSGGGNGFDFGFEQQPMRHSLNGSYSAHPATLTGTGMTSPIGEAHQRF